MYHMATISVNIPSSEKAFFMKLMKKMGWEVNTQESELQKYITSRPKDCPLTDDDIMSEIKAVRRNK